MEKQYRLLSLALVLILSISLASAVTTISVPSKVYVNDNFDLNIYGSSFYAVEIEISESFEIISDPSNGVRTGNIYKTVYSGNLVLQLRAVQTGTYEIKGEYTEGNGINFLNINTISVDGALSPQSCPSCPSNSAWSNCEGGEKIKLVYLCSASTGYMCVELTETAQCQTSSSSNENSQETCEVEWVCKDSNNLAYQSSDCSLSSVQECLDGCSDNKCNVAEEVIENFDENLTIEIQEPAEVESFFDKIKNFFGRIWDFVIFWN